MCVDAQYQKKSVAYQTKILLGIKRIKINNKIRQEKKYIATSPCIGKHYVHCNIMFGRNHYE